MLPFPLIIISTDFNYSLSAILRETSEETSYQMVRLVFRPYTQILRTICTSVSLKASIRISPDFTFFKYRSPSFGSVHCCSNTRLLGLLWYTTYRFLYATQFSTVLLATTNNSLVRVSRRVWLHRKHYLLLTQWIMQSRVLSFLVHDFRSFNIPRGSLFNFPSRYLYAIDSKLIFYLRWRIPPITLHSQETLLIDYPNNNHDKLGTYHPLLIKIQFDLLIVITIPINAHLSWEICILSWSFFARR